MSKNLYKGIAFASMAIAFTACETTDEPQIPTNGFKYSEGAFILNFGSGTNGSTISHYAFSTGTVTNELFQAQNEEALGSNGNHMCAYGSKLYTALSESGKIEITDLNGKRLKKIELKDNASKPLSPRNLASHGQYVYFTAYGGTVQRIDTATLELDAKKVKVGDFPEALTVAGEKLFVNNSKYTDKNVTDEGNTVSVIDLNTFDVVKSIEVSTNPYNQALTAADGNVYIVSQISWNGPHDLQRINPETYEVTSLGSGSVIAAYKNRLYVYYSLWGGDTWFKTYDLTTGEYSAENFLDASKFSYIQALSVNPANGDLYISDSVSKQKGKIVIYGTEGNEKHAFEVGYSPNGAFFPTHK